MTYTSFASTFDRYGYNNPLTPTDPRSFNAARRVKPLAVPFQAAQAPRTPQRDGQMGGAVLDVVFNLAFPGLGAVFSAFSLLDMAEIYDETRAAFGRRGPRPSNPVQAPMPLTQPADRKPRNVMAFMFG